LSKEYTPWHCLSEKQSLESLSTHIVGLTADEAKSRQQKYGKNQITQAKVRPWYRILLSQFNDFMILVLLAAATISGIVGEPQDTIAILVIVFLNAIVGAVQEFRAENAVAALRKMAVHKTYVIRDNEQQPILATELVPGDIVKLEAGIQIPADIRIIKSTGLLANESQITGESAAVEKFAETMSDPQSPLGDRNNLLYKSSVIERGRGIGVVYAIGMSTEIGKIAGMLSNELSVNTPLQKRLRRFGKYLALTILSICAFIFIAGVLQGHPIFTMLLTSISLAVAAIPEALPAVVIISLAFGARKLSKHHTLVRNLPAVETLGSVTYICTDKTGTLTENIMTAELFFVDGSLRNHPSQEESLPWIEMGQALALNNNVNQNEHHIIGEATEVALYHAAQKLDHRKKEQDQKFPRLGEIGFTSERKMMTTLHQINSGIVGYTKGAPEQIIPRCNSQLITDNSEDFNPDILLAEAELLAQQGYRVLAFAKKDFEHMPALYHKSNPDHKPNPDHKLSKSKTDDIEAGLTFIGLVALIDPPRKEVPQAVRNCLAAGITPVMITGDHPGTAKAIAKRIGIANESDTVITGQELQNMTGEEFNERVSHIKVYARVSPEQKIRIVKALQAKQEFVAMTGDGINDAPALKRAGIGIAMGKKGTDVAREAADMVLLDDNFASIVHAVKSGRRIFDNIRKFISYTMSSNAGEIWVLFLAPLVGLPIPLLPIHILWINLVTDGLPGLAFTAEPAEPGIMKRPPRPTNETIFAHGMWQHIIWLGLFIGGISIAAQAWSYHQGQAYWQTMVFTVLTISQLFHCLVLRSEKESLLTIGLFSNIPMLTAVLLTIGLQLLVIYLPMFNSIFYTQPLPIMDLLGCFLLSSSVLIAVEFEKWLVRRKVIYQA